MSEVFVGRMTWRQVEKAIARGAAALFPLGSTEEHGPHGPMGDYLAAEEMAIRVARETGDVVFPCLPFSYSEYFRNFPGTITVSSRIIFDLVGEIVDCLIGHGFKHIVLVNGHKGNESTLLLLVREIRRQKGLLVPIVSPLAMGLTPALSRELYGDAKTGHGAEPMGSLMSYLFPGSVDLSLAEDWEQKPVLGMRTSAPSGLGGIFFEGVEVPLAVCMEDITPPSGSYGDPMLASPDKGRRIVEESVARMVRFVNWFKEMDPVVKK